MPKTLATKRAEAEDRAQARAQRSPLDQMGILSAKRGNSAKERIRLNQQWEAEKGAKS